MRKSPRAAALLLSVAALLAGCAQTRSDDAIATDVKARLYSDAEVRSAPVQVAVKDGEVILTGSVASAALQLKAYKAAAEAAGVKKVTDQLVVSTVSAPVEPVPPVMAPVPAPAPRSALPPSRVDTRTPVPAAPKAEPVAPRVEPTAPAPVPVAEEPRRQAPVARRITIPEGTPLTIRTIDAIDSGRNQPGDEFRAALDAPIQLDGDTVVPAGADVTVRLVESRRAGRVAGRSELQLALATLQHQGRRYELQSSTYQQQGGSKGRQTATRAGIGAGVGAAIGAIAGGGKGAAIGAAVGGGSATAYQILTRGPQVRVPSETRLTFQLEAPVTVPASEGVAPAARRRLPQ